MNTKRILFAVCLMLGSAAWADFTGKCVAVMDGDILFVQKEGKDVQVKLQGVACPEKGQDFNTEALEFAKSLTLDKDVGVLERGLDKEGRIVGNVTVEGKNVGVELLKAGLAWQYSKGNVNLEFSALEASARKDGAGLWSKPNPVPPWEYAKAQKPEEVPAKAAIDAFDCKYQGKPITKAQFDRLFSSYRGKMFSGKNGVCYDLSDGSGKLKHFEDGCGMVIGNVIVANKQKGEADIEMQWTRMEQVARRVNPFMGCANRRNSDL